MKPAQRYFVRLATVKYHILYQLIISICRDEKLQALHTIQLLASRVSDLKSSLNEMTTTVKVDINDTLLVVTDLYSKWRQYQQTIQKGNCTQYSTCITYG